MEARWLWKDFLFRPRSQGRKHNVQPELHILIFHICYFINSTYLDGSSLLSPRMNGSLSVCSLYGVSVICDSAPISQYPLLLAPADVANSLNVYQPDTLTQKIRFKSLSVTLWQSFTPLSSLHISGENMEGLFLFLRDEWLLRMPCCPAGYCRGGVKEEGEEPKEVKSWMRFKAWAAFQVLSSPEYIIIMTQWKDHLESPRDADSEINECAVAPHSHTWNSLESSFSFCSFCPTL